MSLKTIEDLRGQRDGVEPFTSRNTRLASTPGALDEFLQFAGELIALGAMEIHARQVSLEELGFRGAREMPHSACEGRHDAGGKIRMAE